MTLTTQTTHQQMTRKMRIGAMFTVNPRLSAEKSIQETQWQVDARCADESVVAPGVTSIFFSEELQDIAAAKNICAECPVMADCLQGAIERHEPWGVWGGQLFMNGKVLAVKRRRGRPPKVARPEDQIPNIPVPEHLQPILRTA